MPFSSLGRGPLTGTVDEAAAFDSASFRNAAPRGTPESRSANQSVVDLATCIAGGTKATPAWIALASLLARRAWIVPIPGTTKLSRLEENVGAAIELAPGDLREVGSAASKITVHGDRCPADPQARIGR